MSSVSTLPDVTSTKVFIAPSEPIECYRCGLTPVAALMANVKPALLTHPGFILCECYGPTPYSVAEEMLKRTPDANGRILDERTREARECYFDSTRRNIDHRGSSSNAGPSRKAKAGRIDFRFEQAWMGFAQEDRGVSMKLEGMTETLKGKIPRILKARLKEQATREGCKESRLLRWYLAQHLAAVETPHRVAHGSDTIMFHFKVTPSAAIFFNAKKDSLGCSVADLLASVLLREFA